MAKQEVKLLKEVGCCWCDAMDLVEDDTFCPSCGKQNCLHVYREDVKAVYNKQEEKWVEVE
ncbi:hypothetical protein ACQUY5_16735 [Bacillus cereus]|uniref:hypothetical protein n=1 Tax=Bacillus cereus TaxID=1396 RepID=UPI003D16FDFB